MAARHSVNGSSLRTKRCSGFFVHLWEKATDRGSTMRSHERPTKFRGKRSRNSSVPMSLPKSPSGSPRATTNVRVPQVPWEVCNDAEMLCSKAMLSLLRALLASVRAALRTRRDLALENLALRQQLALFNQRAPHPPISPIDRAFWSENAGRVRKN